MTDKQEQPDIQEEETQEEEVSCEKCQEYVHGWKRALADYDNLQKQLAEERNAMRKATTEDLVQQLLPVLDNFDQATLFKPEGLDKKTEQWLQGILHVQKQLETVLDSFSAVPFGVSGEPFDPNIHEAISEEQDDGKKDQTILRVQVRGWKLRGKVIRPARVIVNALSKK